MSGARNARPTLRNISQANSLAAVTPSQPGGGKGPSPMRYAGLGLQLAVSLLVFVWIGQWADRKLGTGGLLTILAALIGFGGTMFSIVRSLNRDNKGE